MNIGRQGRARLRNYSLYRTAYAAATCAALPAEHHARTGPRRGVVFRSGRRTFYTLLSSPSNLPITPPSTLPPRGIPTSPPPSPSAQLAFSGPEHIAHDALARTACSSVAVFSIRRLQLRRRRVLFSTANTAFVKEPGPQRSRGRLLPPPALPTSVVREGAPPAPYEAQPAQGRANMRAHAREGGRVLVGQGVVLVPGEEGRLTSMPRAIENARWEAHAFSEEVMPAHAAAALEADDVLVRAINNISTSIACEGGSKTKIATISTR